MKKEGVKEWQNDPQIDTSADLKVCETQCLKMFQKGRDSHIKLVGKTVHVLTFWEREVSQQWEVEDLRSEKWWVYSYRSNKKW